MKKYTLLWPLLVAFGIASFAQSIHAEVETYTIDPAHSSITFKVRHFFSPLPGNFASFKGTIEVDRENPANNKAEATIEVVSVNTNNQKRDVHLQNEDFFNATVYPQLTFKSTDWKATGKDKFKVRGNLTILGITKEVVLDVKLLGFGKGMRDTYISGWEATTTLDRTDFGITYGQGVIGREVQIEIFVEAQRQ